MSKLSRLVLLGVALVGCCAGASISFNVPSQAFSGPLNTEIVIFGTVSDSSGFQLNASDFAFDFSGYDATVLNIDQLLGLNDFSIADGTTSQTVPLFEVLLTGSAVAGQSYPFLVGLSDKNGDVGNSVTLQVSTSSTEITPEPNLLGLLGGILAIGLLVYGRHRRVNSALVRHLPILLIAASLVGGLSAQTPQFTLKGVTVTEGTGLSVSASLVNSGTRGVSNIQITSAKFASSASNAPTLPITVGNLAAGGSTSLVLTFDGSAFVPGSRYLLTLRGSYILDGAAYGYTVNSFATVPGGASSATLDVQTFLMDTTAVGNKGDPAGAGVYVRLNGIIVGQTGSDGTLTIEASPGQATVKAEIPSTAAGTADVVLQAGQKTTVQLILDDSKEVIENASLVSPDLFSGVLAAKTPTFRLVFQQAGPVNIPVSTLDQVELLNPMGGKSVFLDQDFALSTDGTLAAVNLPAVISALSSITGKLTLRMVAEDSQGFTYSGTIQFFLGQYTVGGSLQSPPSNSALNLAGLTVTATILGSDFASAAMTDSSGQFAFSTPFPAGLLSVKSQTFQSGKYYYGSAQFILTSPRTVNVVMLSTQDLTNHVSPFSLSASATFTTNAAQLSRSSRRLLALPRPQALSAATNAVTATASSAQQDVPISDTATLTVPKGTSKVILTYDISSEEYPYYVGQQSIFNDFWTLNITAGTSGFQMFELTRNVNSQLFIDPIWQFDGTTGQIKKELDVSALTANADTTITVYVAATNIGDSVLTTTVTASLSSDATLTIDNITNNNDISTQNDGTYYSIPRPGNLNTFQRTFNLAITKPDTATVTNVKVIIRNNGAALGTVIDEGSGSAAWQIVDDQNLKVTVTYKVNPVSGISSTPPPTDKYTYQFTVKATDSDGTVLTSDPKDSASMHALWKMPDGVPRYGARDPGGDDWCRLFTYTWISNNLSLLTRVDDVSGEHGKDIGHNTHEQGTDIDNFHFYTFPGGSASGGTNYSLLAQAALAAIAGSASKQAQVTSWVTASRTGLNKLLANSSVDFIYHAIGSATSASFPQGSGQPPIVVSLAAGWARDLLRTGKVTATTGQTLDLGVGQWGNANSSAQMHYNAVHNSHVHVALVKPTP